MIGKGKKNLARPTDGRDEIELWYQPSKWKFGSQSIPRWRLTLVAPFPQLLISSPLRYSWPWKRFRPVITRLEIPAQVMLAVEAPGSGL